MPAVEMAAPAVLEQCIGCNSAQSARRPACKVCTISLPGSAHLHHLRPVAEALHAGGNAHRRIRLHDRDHDHAP